MPDNGPGRILSKKQKEEHKEQIVKWLLDNYLLAADRALPRDVVYEHYCHFCQQKAMFVGGRSFFTKIFAVPFPSLPSRRLGRRGDTRLFYDGLDIEPKSEYYSRVACERLVMPQPSTQSISDRSRKICAFTVRGFLHKSKLSPVTIKTLAPDLHTSSEGHGGDTSKPTHNKPVSLMGSERSQTGPKSGSLATVSQDRLEELDHLLSPSEANDQMLDFLNLSTGTDEQISKMAEELLSQDGQLSELIMSHSDILRSEPIDSRVSQTVTQQEFDSRVELGPNLSNHRSDTLTDGSIVNSCSNDSGIAMLNDDITVHDDTNIASSDDSDSDDKQGNKRGSSQDEERSPKRLKSDSIDLNFNPVTHEHGGQSSVLSWSKLSEEQRKASTDLVLSWLALEYDIAPMVCVPRQTVYKHYLTFCQSANQPVANIKVFGKMLQKQFPSLSMRRLGGRGESKYFYMGIDIVETSCHYRAMQDERILGTKGKPKRSLVTFDKHTIKNTLC